MKANSLGALALILIAVGLLPGAMVLAAAGEKDQAAAARKPNILLIVADDLGYGELGIQGNPQIPTPNIDSLAKSGVRFTSGYVSGPYCSPTRAGLLTGRYQQRFGHEFNPGPAQSASAAFGLSLKEVTLGNRLKDAGYVNGWFGKSHLGYEPQFHPLKRGFDEYFGFLGGAHDYLDAAGDPHNPILRGTNKVDAIGCTTEDFAAEAISFIQKHKDRPWFVYLPFNAVHGPLEATERYLSRFPGIEERKRHTFAGMLSALDDAVGSVMAKVRQLGQEENTLVFFISDNGGPTAQTTSGNGPLRGFKAQTWEGGIRVPFIIRWKGHLPSGKVDDRPVIQLDILPTSLAAAGVEIKPEWKLDGVNLLPFLNGAKAGVPHETLFWRFGGQVAIRKGDWKLVKGTGLASGAEALAGPANMEGAELYNLASDIGEKSNLAAKEPEEVKELAAAWQLWNAELVEPAWRPGPPGTGRRNAAVAALNSNASPNGPWKTGDVLSAADSPRIAGRALVLTAEIEAGPKEGVVVAQGGAAHGFTLFVRNGELSFGVRTARHLTLVTAKEPLKEGLVKIEAQLAADGTITLKVAGKQVAEGRAPGLIERQPARGLTVGRDEGPVAEYATPNSFSGRIRNVSLKLL